MAFNLADMGIAASKMTGVMSLLSENVTKLEGLKKYTQECHCVIEEAKRLLKVKQAELVLKQQDLEKEVFEIQAILGPTTSPKRSNMAALMDVDQSSKRQKNEEEKEENLLYGLGH